MFSSHLDSSNLSRHSCVVVVGPVIRAFVIGCFARDTDRIRQENIAFCFAGYGTRGQTPSRNVLAYANCVKYFYFSLDVFFADVQCS